MTTRLVRLGDVLRLERIPVEISPDEEYVQIGIRSFGKGIFHREKTTGDKLSKLRYFKIIPGRLVVSNIMAWEGAIAVSTEQERGCVGSSRFLSYAPSNEVDIRYLNYYFQSKQGKEIIRRTSTGTVLRNQTLSRKDFENLLLPLPSLDEQHRIADHLDSSFTQIRHIEKLYERRIRLKSAITESIINRAIERSTDSSRINSLIVAARTPTEIDPNKTYRALGMRSFGKGTIRYPAAKGSELSKLRYFRFPSRSLVLSNIKAWEGAIGITDEEDTQCVASSRFLFYLARDERINLSYLRYYLLSRKGLTQIAGCSPGSADRNRTLSAKRFENLVIPLPPREEQDKVAKILDSLDSQIDLSHLKQAEEALRESLLNTAFSGQL